MADSQKKSAQLITEFRKSTVSMAGINYEQTDTMTIRAYGEQTGYSQCISSVGITLSAGTYYLSYKSTNPSSKFKPQLRSSNGGTTYVAADGRFTLSEETTVYPRFVTLGTYTTPINEWLNIMLNEGPQPKPYEPYSATGWLHSLRKLGTATETLSLPQTIYADGTAATIGLKGNEQHTGTPSPSNPIIPQGVGERTENLLSFDVLKTAPSGELVSSVSGTSYTMPHVLELTLKPNTTYILTSNYDRLSGYQNIVYLQYADSAQSPNTSMTPTATTDSSGNLKIGFYDNRTGSDEYLSGTAWLMLNEGQTAKPYEPYGYKIPISNGTTTTPVYLGNVQSERKIGVLVLDGTEDWSLQSINSYGIANFKLLIPVDDACVSGNNPAYCTHYEQQQSLISQTTTEGFLITGESPSRTFYVRVNSADYDTVPKFQAYLTAQYNNGTPVTIYYQYQQAHTGSYNRQLYKIGDYSDSISGISLPTTDGANTISIGTTVQPSEVTATYTGWHDSSVKEYDGTDWQ